MVRGMRAADTSAREHRGSGPDRIASQFSGRGRIFRHREYSSLFVRSSREAEESMVDLFF